MAPVKDRTEASGDLRSHLRAATMAAHDLLDAAMQAASGWQIREDYARFLELQHGARRSKTGSRPMLRPICARRARPR